MKNSKCAMVIDSSLSAGLAANAAAVLGISLGKRHPECVGREVVDADGNPHSGVIEIPVPILAGSETQIRSISAQAAAEGLSVFDFTDLAQGCRTYDEFITKMAGQRSCDHRFIGVALFGKAKRVKALVGALPLYGKA